MKDIKKMFLDIVIFVFAIITVTVLLLAYGIWLAKLLVGIQLGAK